VDPGLPPPARAWQMSVLLYASEDAICIKKPRSVIRVNDVAGNEPGRCGSPRHRVLLSSKKRGVSMRTDVNDVAGNFRQA
jgi:hypothetical protein